MESGEDPCSDENDGDFTDPSLPLAAILLHTQPQQLFSSPHGVPLQPRHPPPPAQRQATQHPAQATHRAPAQPAQHPPLRGKALSLEVRKLARDECKEFQRYGFHPQDILATYGRGGGGGGGDDGRILLKHSGSSGNSSSSSSSSGNSSGSDYDEMELQDSSSGSGSGSSDDEIQLKKQVTDATTSSASFPSFTAISSYSSYSYMKNRRERGGRRRAPPPPPPHGLGAGYPGRGVVVGRTKNGKNAIKKRNRDKWRKQRKRENRLSPSAAHLSRIGGREHLQRETRVGGHGSDTTNPGTARGAHRVMLRNMGGMCVMGYSLPQLG